MNRSRQRTLAAGALLLGATALALGAQGFTVNAGNIIPVVLNQNISTATNKAGDKVEAQCTGGDCGGFPRGTKFFAVLTEVSAKTDKSPGSMRGQFATAVLPDGRHIPIKAQAQAGGVRGTTETKKGNKGKTAAVGATAGALVANNSLMGALVGGAVGHKLGRKSKTTTTDVSFERGTPFQLLMLQTVTVKRAKKKK
jgi:hypothetical protein